MTVAISHIKINRAMRRADIGACPGSALAMLEAVPESVQRALTSAQLAAMLDAIWQASQAAKALAMADAIADGCVWDAARQRYREIAA